MPQGEGEAKTKLI